MKSPKIIEVAGRIGKQGDRHSLEPIVHELQRTFGDILIDLARAEDRQFLEQYLETEPNRLGAGFHETLYQQTAGHPLFTVELLRGMQERVSILGGKFHLWTRVGKGTTISVRVPVLEE